MRDFEKICTKKFYKVCEEPVDGKVIYESKNTFPTRSKFMELEEQEGTDSLLYSILGLSLIHISEPTRPY